MSTPYTVKPGDTLSGIAQKHGFRSWQEIYEDPDNQAFRAKRPNPNLIYPGDVLLLPTPCSPAEVDCGIGSTLRRGDRGEEVRRLQHNLNEALGDRFVPLVESGIFDTETEAAVRKFQQLFKLRFIDGIVGRETRRALATRVLIISGDINYKPSVAPNSSGPPQKVNPPAPPETPSKGGTESDVPLKDGEKPKSAWLIQAQAPVLLLTPPPFYFYDPKHGPKPNSNIYSAGASLGFVFQTATSGPNWQFGGSGQFVFNSYKQATDPRYTLQLQGQVTYADPKWLSGGRFHSAIFGQVAGSFNYTPNYRVVGAGLGLQAGVDITKDGQFNLFGQGVLAGQWTLDGPGKGQFQLSPGFTVGLIIQWELAKSKK